MTIEICANSFKSAQAAQNGGANRIELCENLSVGGVSASRALIKKVISQLQIPVHALIRPRSGGFVYSEKELDRMLDTIDFCKKIGCIGVVSGVLSSEGYIDIEATKKLVKASEGMQFTFHRAFDVCREPQSAINILINLGVHRLLSSGQQPTAIEGIELLKELRKLSEEKIEIMPGSGINSSNAHYFKEAGFSAIHFSAIKREAAQDTRNLFDSKITGHSNQLEIEKVINLLS